MFFSTLEFDWEHWVEVASPCSSLISGGYWLSCWEDVYTIAKWSTDFSIASFVEEDFWMGGIAKMNLIDLSYPRSWSRTVLFTEYLREVFSLDGRLWLDSYDNNIYLSHSNIYIIITFPYKETLSYRITGQGCAISWFTAIQVISHVGQNMVSPKTSPTPHCSQATQSLNARNRAPLKIIALVSLCNIYKK